MRYPLKIDQQPILRGLKYALDHFVFDKLTKLVLSLIFKVHISCIIFSTLLYFTIQYSQRVNVIEVILLIDKLLAS